MDSMRSLNTSLPRSPRRKRSSQPPEKLIQAFKTAALTVTNLYKTAATDEKIARAIGYQEALDDLLTYLDRENIGLDDGEGWRIRQWATERLDGSPLAAAVSDSEEERFDAARRARRSTPVIQRVAEGDQQRQPSRSSSPTQRAELATPSSASTSEVVNIHPRTEYFAFRSAHPYPQEFDVQSSDNAGINQALSSPQSQAVSTPPVRVEVVPRGSRTSHRNSRTNARSGPSARMPTSITDSKRKFPFPDYFDIESMGEGKDTQGGGGKRGRIS